ncbi:hypothetical protein ACLB2K_027455 [Fragaria x ananassa]
MEFTPAKSSSWQSCSCHSFHGIRAGLDPDSIAVASYLSCNDSSAYSVVLYISYNNHFVYMANQNFKYFFIDHPDHPSLMIVHQTNQREEMSVVAAGKRIPDPMTIAPADAEYQRDPEHARQTPLLFLTNFHLDREDDEYR